MDRLVLAAVALAAAIGPVTAAVAEHPAGSADPGYPIAVSPGTSPDSCRSFSGGRDHRRGHRGPRCDYGGWAYADGQWALYNNRSFTPDSYNDWWHDRTDRSFPRWVQEQRGGPCAAERMWWSGSGWHC